MDRVIDRLQTLKDNTEPDMVITLYDLRARMKLADIELNNPLFSSFHYNSLQAPLLKKLLDVDAPKGERCRLYTYYKGIQMGDVVFNRTEAMIYLNTRDILSAAITVSKESGDVREARAFCNILEHVMKSSIISRLDERYTKVPYADEVGAQLEMNLGAPAAAL
ncbi:MAG: hypothetical protein LRY54_03490 [Alphaproteobacteria bacterium]|nr:hypothetical protein [Alphaproteobacteria bacterium]MCD8563110.1 hypothetical protein [Alphaproteobacteria bacterium]